MSARKMLPLGVTGHGLGRVEGGGGGKAVVAAEALGAGSGDGFKQAGAGQTADEVVGAFCEDEVSGGRVGEAGRQAQRLGERGHGGRLRRCCCTKRQEERHDNRGCAQRAKEARHTLGDAVLSSAPQMSARSA